MAEVVPPTAAAAATDEGAHFEANAAPLVYSGIVFDMDGTLTVCACTLEICRCIGLPCLLFACTSSVPAPALAHPVTYAFHPRLRRSATLTM